MASVTQPLGSGQHYAVTVTFNDANGAISRVDWECDEGTLTMTLHGVGKQDIVIVAPPNGGRNIPNGYNMTLHPTKNFWYWESSKIAFDIAWEPA